MDEFDIGAFDERAAAWWLRQRHAFGAAERASAEELVDEHRAHLHPLERIVAALEPHFHVGTPLYGPYLYRAHVLSVVPTFVAASGRREPLVRSTDKETRDARAPR